MWTEDSEKEEYLLQYLKEHFIAFSWTILYFQGIFLSLPLFNNTPLKLNKIQGENIKYILQEMHQPRVSTTHFSLNRYSSKLVSLFCLSYFRYSSSLLLTLSWCATRMIAVVCKHHSNPVIHANSINCEDSTTPAASAEQASERDKKTLKSDQWHLT